jgi:hypothetical protein
MVQNRALRDRMTEPPFSTIFADGRVAGFLIYQVGLAMKPSTPTGISVGIYKTQRKVMAALRESL